MLPAESRRLSGLVVGRTSLQTPDGALFSALKSSLQLRDASLRG